MSTSLPAFNIEVVNTNDAPTITGTPVTGATVGNPYTFTPGGGDVDMDDTLTYTIAGNPTWLSIGSSSGVVSGTPGNDDVGDFSGIVITVSDGSLTKSLDPFTITVTDVNSAPTITGTPPTTVAEGERYIFAPGGGDVDTGDTLTYTITGKPDWIRLFPATGILNGTPGNADVGVTGPIVLSVSDAAGATASLDPFTITVTDVNSAPTITAIPDATAVEDALFSYTVDATDFENDPLTYSLSGNPAWLSIDSTTGVLSGTPTNADVTAGIDVTVTVSDDTTRVPPTSDQFMLTVTNVNDPATGVPTITGTVTQGETLTAGTSAIRDGDGPTTLTFTYQWNAGGTAISDATSRTFEPTQAQVGNTITVTVSYPDGGGTVETLTSASTTAVMNVNDLATGVPTITGTATQGETLTAGTSAIADIDGLGGFDYQWNAGGTAISGATSRTFTLTQAQVGNTITVTVSFTDDGGTVENVTSGTTATVTNTNDRVTGVPTISGTATQGGTLTAGTSAIADTDGLGTFRYQWNAGGTAISGATSRTFEPTQAQVGNTITVTVSFTDDGGTVENVTSGTTATVTNTNDAVTGVPTITGTVEQGGTLTAVTTGIADTDGLGTFRYQWNAGDTAISGATSRTFVLTQAQVGNTITVTVSFTDGGGTVESVISAATGATGDVPDAPTITGKPRTTAIVDALYSFTPGGGDIDGTPLVYTITGMPTWATFDEDTGTLTGTPEATDLEDPTSDIVITVTSGGMSASLRFTLTVSEVTPGFVDLNKVVLPETARAMTDLTVNTITQRMDQARSGAGSRSMTIAGQSTLAGVASVHGQAIADGTLSLKDVLGNSDFVLSLADDEAGMGSGMLSTMTFWGGGNYQSFEGSGEGTSFDGNLFSANLGVDARLRDDLLTGLAVSWSQSDLDYKGDNLDGDYKLDLTSIQPYASWEVLAGQLDLWVTAGYGWGDLKILNNDQQGEEALSDVEAWNMAVGGNMELLQEGPARFRLKSSALLTEMKVEGSDAITALEVESSLFRMILEGAYKYALADGAYVEPSLEAGARYDGGDGETGFGAELGAGFRYTDPTVGLTLESKLRTLVGRDNYKEWGISGLILLEQGRNGRGLSFSLSPGYGDTGSGTQKVWQGQGSLGGETRRDYGARLDTRLGYGMTAPGDGFTCS